MEDRGSTEEYVSKEEVIQLLESKRESSFRQHFLYCFTFPKDLCGCVKESSVSLWYANRWIGIFYPIFRFEFDKDNHLTDIKSQRNPVASSIQAIFVLWFSYFIVFQPMIESPGIPLDYLLFIGIISLPYLVVFWKLGNYNTKEQFETLCARLSIATFPKKVQSEFSFSSIVLRCISYPLALFLIVLPLVAILSMEPIAVFKFLFGAIIGLLYLYVDTKLWLSYWFQKKYSSKDKEV